MAPKAFRLTLISWLASIPMLSAKLTPEQVQSLPSPATHQVSFSKEVQPIFETSCINCHGRGKEKGGFRMDTREDLLKGGDYGPAIVVGKSAESYLIELVSGIDPDNVMPEKGTKLTATQVGVLRAWIDQGAQWDEGISFGKVAPKNLVPREPELPAAIGTAKSKNPVDLILASYFAKHGFNPPAPVDDQLYARRVYFDIIGLPPSPEDLETFAADQRPDKRQRLVRRLLADQQRYAEHWLTFWNDLLRNDYKGTGYIDGGRKQITGWLYQALYDNKPFDQFVSELVNPRAGSEGFAKGIVWRGVVNASQTPEMQAAQNISQVFMGVNLKCASCHDSFINDWALADAYGLASIYASGALEMVQCDKPTGKMSEMRFIYPELGAIDPTLKKDDRLAQLAKIVTSQQNGRLTRTIVNRLWARMMGRGLVEPVDEMDNAAWNADVLDWLASDLARNGYDLKQTIERIATSQAYQLPSTPMTERLEDNFEFRGPIVRRLSAEQFVDTLATVTGAGYTLPASQIELDFPFFTPTNKLSRMERGIHPKWIWNTPQAARRADARTVYFRKMVEFSELPTEALVIITCDNGFKLFVNGKEVSSGRDYGKPRLVDILSRVKKGWNVIAVEAVNDLAHPDKKDDPSVDQGSPAGLLLLGRVRHERKVDGVSLEKVFDFVSDASWLCTTDKMDKWNTTDATLPTWDKAFVLGSENMEPWRVGERLANTLSAALLYRNVRASLVTADPLMVALGRPNREQVLTSRPSAATTLQALELTNGETLAKQLQGGAEKLIADYEGSSEKLVAGVYQRALGRVPTMQEKQVMQELVGSPARKEGVEDLLWMVAMLPEFQLIY